MRAHTGILLSRRERNRKGNSTKKTAVHILGEDGRSLDTVSNSSELLHQPLYQVSYSEPSTTMGPRWAKAATPSMVRQSCNLSTQWKQDHGELEARGLPFMHFTPELMGLEMRPAGRSTGCSCLPAHMWEAHNHC